MNFWLLVVIVFSSLFQSDAYTETQTTKEPCFSTTHLVRSQTGTQTEQRPYIEVDLEDAQLPPLQRPTTALEDSICSQGFSNGSSRLEMWILSHYESKEGGVLSDMWASLANLRGPGQLMELVFRTAGTQVAKATKWKCKTEDEAELRQRAIQGQRQNQAQQWKRPRRKTRSLSFCSRLLIFSVYATQCPVACDGLYAVPAAAFIAKFDSESSGTKSNSPGFGCGPEKRHFRKCLPCQRLCARPSRKPRSQEPNR